MKRTKRTYKELALEFKRTRGEKVFTELYERMRPGMRNYVYKIVKDWDVTDDIVSNTLTKVYFKIEQYNPDYQITTWAYRIAYNECIGWVRQRNKKVSLSVFADKGIEATTSSRFSFQNPLHDYEVPMTENDHWEEETEIQARDNMLKEAIYALPPMYKEYMITRFLNHKSYNEILEIMRKVEKGVSLQTVKNRIFRGRKIIRKQLQNTRLFAEVADTYL
jgi:RNA polymerase sigma-70 factor (ECF subfamily)